MRRMNKEIKMVMITYGEYEIIGEDRIVGWLISDDGDDVAIAQNLEEVTAYQTCPYVVNSY